jgi:hypothetical protein
MPATDMRCLLHAIWLVVRELRGIRLDDCASLEGGIGGEGDKRMVRMVWMVGLIREWLAAIFF